MLQVLRRFFGGNVRSRVGTARLGNSLTAESRSTVGAAFDKLRREQASVLSPLSATPSQTQLQQLQHVSTMVCEVQDFESEAMRGAPVLLAPGCLSPERSGVLRRFLQWENILETSNDCCYFPEQNNGDDFVFDEALYNCVPHEFANAWQRGDPYYVVNLLDIVAQMKRWNEELPFARPYFAAKCNFDPTILRLLHALDCGFDCASPGEFHGLFDLGLLDVNSEPLSDQCVGSNTIFSNPCKSPAALRIARQMAVKFFTVDSVYEVSKLKREVPDACALVRLKVDDSNSICRFSSKFGADFEETLEILHECHRVGLRTVGVNFHVGSGCQDPNQFDSALAMCRQVFDALKADCVLSASPWLSRFDVIDLGGGFPGVERMDGGPIGDSVKVTFESIAEAVRRSLALHFPVSKFGPLNRRKLSCTQPSATGLTVIAEPGRFFVTKSHTLVCEVIAKKRQLVDDNNVVYKYYLNEGVYHSFNAMYFDHVEPHFIGLRKDDVGNNDSEHVFESVLFGPTCDAMDTMAARGSGLFLPELHVSDKILVPAFGAYTVTASSNFNGFPPAKCFYVT